MEAFREKLPLMGNKYPTTLRKNLKQKMTKKIDLKNLQFWTKIGKKFSFEY